MKSTFSFALILFISLFSLNTYAQKCNLDVDEVDGFTKEHVKAGTCHVAPMLYHWKLTLKKSGSKYGWEMQIKWGQNISEAMRKGEIIYLKLENNEVIQLVLDNDYPSSQVVDGQQIITTFMPKGALDEASMKKISESPLSGIRVVLSGKTVEPNISSKQGENVQNIAQCIMMP